MSVMMMLKTIKGIIYYNLYQWQSLSLLHTKNTDSKSSVKNIFKNWSSIMLTWNKYSKLIELCLYLF